MGFHIRLDGCCGVNMKRLCVLRGGSDYVQCEGVRLTPCAPTMLVDVRKCNSHTHFV